MKVGGVSSHEEALNTRPAVDRNPGWSVETLLVGLQSFMLSEESAADRSTPGVSAYLCVSRRISANRSRKPSARSGRPRQRESSWRGGRQLSMRAIRSGDSCSGARERAAGRRQQRVQPLTRRSALVLATAVRWRRQSRCAASASPAPETSSRRACAAGGQRALKLD